MDSGSGRDYIPGLGMHAGQREDVAVKSLVRLLTMIMVCGSIVVGSSSAAHADCDWYNDMTIRKGDSRRVATHRGVTTYNATLDPVKKTRTVTVTRTHSNTHSVEIGAEAGWDWGPVKAKLSAKYGHQSTSGVSKGLTESTEMFIRSHHSGWLAMHIYVRKYVIKKWRKASFCDLAPRLVGKATYRDRYAQEQPTTRRGRVDF